LGVGAEVWTGPSSSRITHYEYEQLVDRILTVVDGMVPDGATVLVVSKGDEKLLQLGGREAWHFPRDEDGRYAGFYPVDSAAAIAHLEELRSRGARYIVFPTSTLWWLEHYEDFGRHLAGRYRTVLRKEDTCLIFELEEKEGESGEEQEDPQGKATQGKAGPARQPKRRLYGEQRLARQLEEVVGAILPPRAACAVVALGDPELLALDGRECRELGRSAAAEPGAAIERLESMRSSGAEFLVVPAPAFEWLERQPELVDHLAARHRLVTRQQHVCVIYELVRPNGAGSTAAQDADRTSPSTVSTRRSLLDRLLGRKRSDHRV
jgi:hypothetical protein